MGVRPTSIGRTSKQTALPQEQLFDTHPEVSLDFEIVREKVRRLRAAMPRVRPHYAVKANPDRRVIKALLQEGCSFEIASTAELDLLLALGAKVAEVFYSNPMKSRQAISYAAARGIEWFVVDSVDELRRVHEVKGGARVYLRGATSNIGSDWPPSGKFGAGASET